MNRRNFLKGVILGGAVLAIVPTDFLSAKEVDKVVTMRVNGKEYWYREAEMTALKEWQQKQEELMWKQLSGYNDRTK
jgi:hypothetical protein